MDIDIYRKVNDDRARKNIGEEARIANHMQENDKTITRTEALKHAKRIVEERGDWKV